MTRDDEPGLEDGVCRPVECPPEEEVLMGDPMDTDKQAEAHALVVARADWERQQLQKRMQRASRDVLAKYLPKPTAKHRPGATKPTIEAKKAKNRARRKANKGNR